MSFTIRAHEYYWDFSHFLTGQQWGSASKDCTHAKVNRFSLSFTSVYQLVLYYFYRSNSEDSDESDSSESNSDEGKSCSRKKGKLRAGCPCKNNGACASGVCVNKKCTGKVNILLEEPVPVCWSLDN